MYLEPSFRGDICSSPPYGGRRHSLQFLKPPVERSTDIDPAPRAESALLSLRLRKTMLRIISRFPFSYDAAFTPKATGRRASIQSQRIDAFQAPGARASIQSQRIDAFQRAASPLSVRARRNAPETRTVAPFKD